MVSLKNTKKLKIIILIIAVTLVVGVAILYRVNDSRQRSQVATGDQVKPDINYDPPTKEEKKQADDNKSRLIEEENNSQSPPSASNKASVTPQITIAEVSGDYVELGSYVPGMFENNGNCIATFTKGAGVITRQVQSVAEGRATYCPVIKVPLSEFPEKGTWRVKVTYDSTAYTGASPEGSIEIR